MNSNPQSELPPSPAPLATFPRPGEPTAAGAATQGQIRLTLAWTGTVVIASATGLLVFMVIAIVFGWVPFRGSFFSVSGASAALVALAAATFFAKRGPPPGWPRGRRFWVRYSSIFLVPGGLSAVCFFAGLRPLFLISEERHAMDSISTIARAADQFFLEHPERIFVRYQDLVGPRQWIKSLEPKAAEDYRSVFPIRRDFPEPLAIVLPGGRKIEYDHNPLAELPLPQNAPGGKPIPHASPRPPVPTAPVAVHTVLFPDGSRFEVAYRAGVRHGPFRALYADGTKWGEATYEQGVLVGRHRVFDQLGNLIHETEFPPVAGRK